MASTLADSRKHSAAERLTELASAARDFTNHVEYLPYLQDYTDAAAKSLDQFAEYVDDTDIPEMLQDMASFAKRKPVATLALGVAAGLVTTQLMRGWPMSIDAGSGQRSARPKTTRKRKPRR